MAAIRFIPPMVVLIPLLLDQSATGAQRFDPLVVQPPLTYVNLAPGAASRYFGQIESVASQGFVLRLRNGDTFSVDAASAIARHLAVVFYSGEPVRVDGNAEKPSSYSALIVARVKADAASWGMDIPAPP